MNDKELREKIDLIIPWLGDEYQLRIDRPDLYNMWLDYIHRKGSTNNTDYERKLNMWLLHYFLVHGKS